MKLIKIFSFLIVLSFSNGCTDDLLRTAENVDKTSFVKKVCLGGVKYYIHITGYPTALAPVFNKEGKVELCKRSVK